MPERIPPKGQTSVEIEVLRTPHGCDVIINLRSLGLAAKMQGDPKRGMLFAFRALGAELSERGVNLYAAIANMPDALDREDISDG